MILRCRRQIALVAAVLACGGADCEHNAGHHAAIRPAATGPVPAAATTTATTTPAAAVKDSPDAEYGRQMYLATCATCHGTGGQGMPHQGVSLRDSKFVATAKDDTLLEFLQKGRPAGDPQNHSGVAMPPRGGNTALSDAHLRDVIAYLRTVQKDGAAAASARE